MANTKTTTETNTETTVEDVTPKNALNSDSPFVQASQMNINQAVGILAQASQLAQKAGVLTVNDAVLVARALELVRKPNETA